MHRGATRRAHALCSLNDVPFNRSDACNLAATSIMVSSVAYTGWYGRPEYQLCWVAGLRLRALIEIQQSQMQRYESGSSKLWALMSTHRLTSTVTVSCSMLCVGVKLTGSVQAVMGSNQLSNTLTEKPLIHKEAVVTRYPNKKLKSLA
jgi:hypothetical protein